MNNSEQHALEIIPLVSPGFFTERLPDSLLVLHPSLPRWMEINATGYEILKLVDGKRRLKDIIGTITQQFEIPFERAKTDVISFFNSLHKVGFLDNQSNSSDRRSDADRPAAYHLFLHLNRDCNLACPHCYTRSQPESQWVPSPEDILRVLDDCADNGCVALTVSGGEPLLYSAFERILRHASERFKTSLLTNGTLIDKTKIPLLTECCQGIQISLDGSISERHDAIRGQGTFDRTVNAIKLLQDAGYNENLVICTTVMRQNLDDVLPIIGLADRLGIPLLRFLPLMAQGRAEQKKNRLFPTDDELILLYHELLPYLTGGEQGPVVSGYISGILLKPIPGPAVDQWCPIGRNIVMDFDGNVSPCILMLEKNWKIGNLFQESLAPMLERGVIHNMGEMIRSRRNRIAKCRSCSWKNFCQAGCAGIALQQKGTMNDVDRLCDFRRELYPLLFSQILQKRRELVRERAGRRGSDPPFHGKGSCP